MTATAIRAGRTPRRRRTLRGRFLALVLRAISGALVLLPPGPLHVMAHLAGRAVYLAQPERRALVRSNLRRVCRWLAANEMAGAGAQAAAADDAALERLVRAAFGHYVRGYLEAATIGAYASERGRARVTADDPQLVDEMLGPAGGLGRAALIIGLHFGAIEVPALHAAARGVELTSPMEVVADPDLQAWLERSRGATGLRIIPVGGAAAELADCLHRGRPVAIVADRVVEGVGARVELFGAPARLPVGPAALALATGAPAYAVAARRTGWGRYRVRVERVVVPDGDSRRQRTAAFMAAEARLFERLIADAPEQWWTLFFPIWEEAVAVRAER